MKLKLFINDCFKIKKMILVFKTSVKTQKDVLRLRKFLNLLPGQSKWNFDLEDCDKILRIDTETALHEEVINILKNNGYHCIELTD
jgi:hypothetical protein